MNYEWREIKTWPSVEDGIYQKFEKGDFKCWVVKTASVGAEASVGDRASVGAGARVGDRAIVGAGASVGAWAIVGAEASVGAWASVGAGARVGAGASVGAWARVGDRARVGAWASVQHCFSFGPVGSRKDTLHFMPELGMFSTGCFYGDEDALRAALAKTHASDKYTKPYAAAIKALKDLATAAGVKRDKSCDPKEKP